MYTGKVQKQTISRERERSICLSARARARPLLRAAFARRLSPGLPGPERGTMEFPESKIAGRVSKPRGLGKQEPGQRLRSVAVWLDGVQRTP